MNEVSCNGARYDTVKYEYQHGESLFIFIRKWCPRFGMIKVSNYSNGRGNYKNHENDTSVIKVKHMTWARRSHLEANIATHRDTSRKIGCDSPTSTRNEHFNNHSLPYCHKRFVSSFLQNATNLPTSTNKSSSAMKFHKFFKGQQHLKFRRSSNMF